MKNHRNQRGFTLIELVLSLGILAILAALAAPMFGNNEALEIDVTRRLLISDLEYSQILAITNPQETVALVIDDAGKGWHIATTSDPTVPLNDSITGEPLVTVLGEGPATSASTISIESNASNNMIAFDQNGGLIDFTQVIEIILQVEEVTSVIQIIPTTGSIQ